MIGEWVAENALGIIGTIFGLSGPFALFLAWVLRKWLAQSFELRKPRLTDAEKAEEMERLARSVLSTPVIREFAESSIVTEEQSARFFETVENIVTRSMAVRDCMREQAKHVALSQESALRVVISDAVRGVGAELQKQLSDSQALFMSELRAMRAEMSESIKAVADRVTALDTDLQVHEAEDRAKK